MYTLKKSLGQHFLIDETVSTRIVDALLQVPFTRLLEIGPGGGALTKYLLQLRDIDFKCIEIDEEKVKWLQPQYPALRDKIIHQSFLDAEKPFTENFAVVGNFPYNISTEIVFKLLDWRDNLDVVIGMFQKEVAERLASKEGSKVYGVTSVLIQAYFDIEYLFEVSETAFNPPPKVKSAVLRFNPRKEPLKMRNYRSFAILVKTAFNQRRKTLRNSVKSLFDEGELEDSLFNKRAEQLSLEDFAALTYRMQGASKDQQGYKQADQ